MFLVTGSTGNVGGELVSALANAGQPVRALVRGDRETSWPASVEAVSGDLNRPDSLTTALAGVRGVFLLPGYEDMPGLVAELEAASVERVVLLSSGAAASGDMSNAISRYMITSESAVRASKLTWTILRPTAFMSNSLRWLPQLAEGDVIRGPFADVRTAAIDPFDIAAVAVRALLDDGYHRHIYGPTGPTSLRPADQIAILADILGRDLRFEPQTDDEARQQMLRNTPLEYVDAFFDFYSAGSLDESQVGSTVQDVTGQPPRTFRQWATAHREMMSRDVGNG